MIIIIFFLENDEYVIVNQPNCCIQMLNTIKCSYCYEVLKFITDGYYKYHVILILLPLN